MKFNYEFHLIILYKIYFNLISIFNFIFYFYLMFEFDQISLESE